MLRPFLDVIRDDHTSSTVTAAALEAVQTVLHTWPWHRVADPLVMADAMSDVVDSVSHCRFQETTPTNDHQVLVLVVHVLHAVLTAPHCAEHLSDHSMWQLVESLFALSRSGRNDVRSINL